MILDVSPSSPSLSISVSTHHYTPLWPLPFSPDLVRAFGSCPTQWESASPICLLPRSLPFSLPFLLVNASNDYEFATDALQFAQLYSTLTKKGTHIHSHTLFYHVVSFPLSSLSLCFFLSLFFCFFLSLFFCFFLSVLFYFVSFSFLSVSVSSLSVFHPLFILNVELPHLVVPHSNHFTVVSKGFNDSHPNPFLTQLTQFIHTHARALNSQ